jgi:RNA polymerase sigma factor (sigma-70 family)
MEKVTESVRRKLHRGILVPSYIYHPDFSKRSSAKQFDAVELLNTVFDHGFEYMPDDVTKDHARRMHYCAHRMHAAKSTAEIRDWQEKYHALRDQIVLGNRKLVYRAVRRRSYAPNLADDQASDCHIVLIQAVAAFNPWLGIRFSTYAYTCLVRALSRMAQKLSADWNTRAMPLEALPDGEPKGESASSSSSGSLFLDEYLRDDHPLLTAREKSIISRRFCLSDINANTTLEGVGRALGLSKERVRQVQQTAMDKLRLALNPVELAV